MGKLKHIFALFIFCTITTVVVAQPDPNCPPDNPNCPIDGGVALLVAAAIGLAAKKMHLKNKSVSAF